MSDIRIWARDIALLLIATGIILKTLSSQSEKNLLRAVTALILITAVFRINTTDIQKALDIDIRDEIECETGFINEKIESYIGKISEDAAADIIRDKVLEYDEKAEVKVKTGDERIKIEISGSTLTNAQFEKIKAELSESFEGEIVIERGEKDG